MASGVYSCPALAVTPRGYSPLVILAHMLAHPSGRLRRCSLRTYGSTVHLLRLPVGSPSLSLRVDSCTARVTDKRRVRADSRLQHLGSAFGYPLGLLASALKSFAFSAVTQHESPAIKSASFPMALLHGFLDRHPLRRKHGYYTKISAADGLWLSSGRDNAWWMGRVGVVRA